MNQIMYNHMFNKNHLNLKNNFIKLSASWNPNPQVQSRNYEHSKIELKIYISCVIDEHISTHRKIVMVCKIMGEVSFCIFQVSNEYVFYN